MCSYEAVRKNLHYSGDTQISKERNKNNFCTSFCCLKKYDHPFLQKC